MEWFSLVDLAQAQALLIARRKAEALAQGNRASDALKAALAPEPARQAFDPLALRRQIETARYRPSQAEPANVRHYPAVGLAFIKAECTPAGRLWLLGRWLDRSGAGFVSISALKARFCELRSPLRIFSCRWLRKIIHAGQGRLWDRDGDRLYLYGPARLLRQLNGERLTGDPVLLPVKTLTATIREFKAAMYASFHAGRRDPGPISRACMTKVTGLSERSQRRYDGYAGVKRTANYLIGEGHTKGGQQNQAAEHGRCVITFVDHNGTHGKPGSKYLARRLPNSYVAPIENANRGRQRKINRDMVDLVTTRAQGNGQKPAKLFYAHAKPAYRGSKKHPVYDMFWRSGGGSGSGLWYQIPARSRPPFLFVS